MLSGLVDDLKFLLETNVRNGKAWDESAEIFARGGNGDGCIHEWSSERGCERVGLRTGEAGQEAERADPHVGPA